MLAIDLCPLNLRSLKILIDFDEFKRSDRVDDLVITFLSATGIE